MSRENLIGWNSDIRIKDGYGATNGIAEVMWDELGWRESSILAINRGTGDSRFLGSLMDRDIDQGAKREVTRPLQLLRGARKLPLAETGV